MKAKKKSLRFCFDLYLDLQGSSSILALLAPFVDLIVVLCDVFHFEYPQDFYSIKFRSWFLHAHAVIRK